MKPLILTETFEGQPLTILTHKGRPAWIAREIGALLEYADPSKLGEKIRGDWSDDFIEGHDLVLLEGAELAALKRAVATDTPDSGVSTLASTNRALLLLTETGLFMALMKTEKEVGRRLRRFLVAEVLPKLARGQTVGVSPAQRSRELQQRRLLWSDCYRRGDWKLGDQLRRDTIAELFGIRLDDPAELEPLARQEPLPKA